ncbi:hypothetical protein KCU67_g8836, partial [Aureobasidium melanogenum]
MLSFLDLPPEIRSMIYKMLLQDTFAKDTRILYFGDNPLRSGVDPDRIRHKQPFERICSQGDIEFLNTKSILARHIAMAEYIIHLADIDDLLFLAATCHLLRSELLALAWSNADVRVASPETYNELHCIFYDRLTIESCNFIRTLQLNVDGRKFLSPVTRKIVGLVRNRLVQLQQLTVCLFETYGAFEPYLSPGVAALRSLPLHITVHLRYYTSIGSRNILCVFHRGIFRRRDKSKNTRLQSLRTKVSLIVQKRKEERAKQEQGDQTLDVLEATVEMRSLMVG